MLPLHIAITSRFPSVPYGGGTQRVSDTLARGLTARGFSVFFYSLIHDNSNFPYPAQQLSSPSQDFTSFEAVHAYHEFLREYHIDVIINQDGLFETSELFLNTGGINIRKISVIHSSPFYDYSHLWYKARTLRSHGIVEKLKRIARMILYPRTKWRAKCSWRQHYRMLEDSRTELCFLSPRCREEFRTLVPDYPWETHSIANPNTYSKLPEPDYSKKNKEVLFVGRLDNRSKQLPLLLKIWAKVSKICPDWQLSIVGAGPDGEMLQKMARKLRLSRLTFHGRQDPLPFYQRASILCLTSLYEGFPMVLTEAQQNGVVPIAFDSFPAVHDIIEHGKTGVIAKAFNIKDFTEKLIKLMQHNLLRRSMSHAAQKAVQRYSEERIIDEWTKCLNKEKA